LKQKGDITKKDFARFLEERHYFATEKEIGYLMNRFDKNKDGIITYSEYIQEFTQRL
jgi:Ca2+-binding EF-hand superfamily protein